MVGGNPDNLKPFRSTQEAREKGKKGGIKSGESRRQKSTAREVSQMVLAGNIPVENAKDAVRRLGLPETEMNVRAAILAGTAVEAIKGNVRASEYLFNLAGEIPGTDPVDNIKVYSGLPAKVIGKAYVDVNRAIDERRYIYYDFKGGRGSLKSSFCGLKLVDLIMQHDNFCAMAIRQVKDTLKDSVYSQIVWAIDELGLTEQFVCTKSPMEIRRKETGQKIYFRGADDPMKIKSVRPPKGMYIGVTWIEEADQLHGEDALRNILQSVMRGGNESVIFRSFNTPRSQSHFINVEQRKSDTNRLIHHSYYYEAPREWLGASFFDLADQLKFDNETAYRHEYLGEAVGNGGQVFENVTLREIPDKEIRLFDRLYYGVDWGWFPDPNHFAAMYFNMAQRKLYIFGELRCYKTKNEDFAVMLDQYRDVRITADSAENKSIQDFRDYGFDMRGAIKGPGSVDYSMKWLASLKEIIIDNKRCPYTADEFLLYEYERTKNNEIISGYPDKNNHAIDAVRYALEEVWRRRGQ